MKATLVREIQLLTDLEERLDAELAEASASALLATACRSVWRALPLIAHAHSGQRPYSFWKNNASENIRDVEKRILVAGLRAGFLSPNDDYEEAYHAGHSSGGVFEIAEDTACDEAKKVVTAAALSGVDSCGSIKASISAGRTRHEVHILRLQSIADLDRLFGKKSSIDYLSHQPIWDEFPGDVLGEIEDDWIESIHKIGLSDVAERYQSAKSGMLDWNQIHSYIFGRPIENEAIWKSEPIEDIVFQILCSQGLNSQNRVLLFSPTGHDLDACKNLLESPGKAIGSPNPLWSASFLDLVLPEQFAETDS